MVSLGEVEDGRLVTTERGQASGFQTPLIDVPYAIFPDGPRALWPSLTRPGVSNDVLTSNEFPFYCIEHF